MHTDDPREAKLPKWAQELIADLRRTIGEQARTITTLNWEHTDSNVFLTGGRRADDLALPKFSQVRFVQGHNRDISVGVNRWPTHGKVGVLEIYGSRSLIIHPCASNVLQVDVET